MKKIEFNKISLMAIPTLLMLACLLAPPISAVSIDDIKTGSCQNPSSICTNYTINATCQRGLQGEQGINGTAATINIGNVYTLPSTDSAYVTNMGNMWDALLDFGIPIGYNGTDGINGINGTNGIDGINGINGTNDHHLLTNLTTFDDHSQYALLAGRIGGQTITGGASTGNLTLNGSANNGGIYLNPKGGGVNIGGNINPSEKLVIQEGNIYLKHSALSTEYRIYIDNYASTGVHELSSTATGLKLLTPYGSAENISLIPGGGFGAGNIFLIPGETGKIGIGTTKLGEKLTIQDGSIWLRHIANQVRRIYIDNYAGTDVFDLSAQNGFFQISAPSNEDISLSVSGSGKIKIPSLGAGTVMSDANGALYVISDPKYKTNITKFVSSSKNTAISQINSLAEKGIITFKFTKESGLDTENYYTGWDAAEVKKIIPDAVSTKDDVEYITKKDGDNVSNRVSIKTGNQTMSINDRAIIVTLVNGITEQQTQINAQQKQIDELTSRLEKLEGAKL